jgi:hypothetical protein
MDTAYTSIIRHKLIRQPHDNTPMFVNRSQSNTTSSDTDAHNTIMNDIRNVKLEINQLQLTVSELLRMMSATS